MLLGSLHVLLVCYWDASGSVGASWGALGALLGCSWVLLGCFGCLLRLLGVFLGVLKCSWGALGVLLGCFGDLLVVLRVPGCAYGSLLKPRWVFLEPLRVVNMRIRARTQQNVKQSACGM